MVAQNRKKQGGLVLEAGVCKARVQTSKVRGIDRPRLSLCVHVLDQEGMVESLLCLVALKQDL